MSKNHGQNGAPQSFSLIGMPKAGLAACAALLSLTAAGCTTMEDGASSSSMSSQAVSQQSVVINTAEGSVDALLYTPEGTGAWPAVIVWSDLVGIRPVFGDMGRRLAANGYVVLVPNSFYRSAKIDGLTATPALTSEQRGERFGAWRGTLNPEAQTRDAHAYVNYVKSLPQVSSSKRIGMLGFEAGAEHAFRAAIAEGASVGAVAGLYPWGIATSRENSPHLHVGKTSADYYVIMSSNDDEREPEDKDMVREAFASAGLSGEVEVSTARGGFSASDNAAYDAAEAERAWAKMLALFNAAL